jgi:hypothetical protein
MREGVTRDAVTLCCEDCGRVQRAGESGWHGMLGREDDDRVVVVIICPNCHEREFEQAG